MSSLKILSAQRRLSVWVQKSSDICLSKRHAEEKHRERRGKDAIRIEAEFGMIQPQGKMFLAPLEVRRDKGEFSPRVSGESVALPHSDFRLLPSRTIERINYCHCHLSQFVIVYYSSHGKLIHLEQTDLDVLQFSVPWGSWKPLPRRIFWILGSPWLVKDICLLFVCFFVL